MIALAYPAQLESKRAHVVTVSGRYAELADVPTTAVVPAAPVVRYRNRAKLVVDGARVGLYAQGTHDVIDLPDCQVLDPTIAVVVREIRRRLPLPVRVYALDLQRIEEGVLLSLVVPTETGDAPLRDVAARLFSSIPGIAGIAVSKRDESSHQVLGRTPTNVAGLGRARARVHDAGPFHYVVAGSFSQAHRGQQRTLVDELVATMRRRGSLQGRRVVELYSGAGVLALSLAREGAHVLAAEAYAPAADLCREAASEQDLDVTVRAADAAVVTEELLREGTQVDDVVVNPPRRGLSPSVRADLAALAPRMILYVSCEPSTLCRDLADFARRGYLPSALAPYDMMPLTEEVETLAVLEPREPPLPVVLYEDERLIAVVKSPHEPTTPQGEHTGSLLARVRRLPSAGEAVPVHRLDVGTSGVCLFARRPMHVESLAHALASGEKEYVALCRGITREKGSVRRPLLERGQPRPSRTRYVRREVIAGHSLLVVHPDEGRKHQIRRHLASIGHPVVGDGRYGDERTNRHFELRHFLDRPFLHCARITLAGNDPLSLEAPLAPDLALIAEAARRANR